MPKYCPTCGNSDESIKFYGNFCEACTKDKFSKTLIKEVEIPSCKRCGKIKGVGGFVSPTSVNIGRAIEQLMGKYRVRMINYENDQAKLEVSYVTEYGPLSVDHEVAVTYKKALCDLCYKKACSYHEAVIQLRGDRRRMEKFQDKITRYFDSHNEFVGKVEEADRGVNMYMSNKKMAASFISKMGLKPNTSFTLAGLKNGRRVYKNTYALRFE